ELMQARDGSLPQQPLQKTKKSDAAVNVAPVASQVDSGENDFLVPAPLQFAYLLDDLLGRQAAAAAADGGNHAKGAARVAPVLNLERRTSAVIRKYRRKMELLANLTHQDRRPPRNSRLRGRSRKTVSAHMGRRRFQLLNLHKVCLPSRAPSRTSDFRLLTSAS